MKALRLHRSETARLKRRKTKDIIFKRTVAMFSRLRKKRKNK